MPDIDLYVIAAGVGSRIGIKSPKALMSIAGEPCLTTTLQQIGHKFRRTFIVTNYLVSEQWRDYFQNLEATYPELARSTVNVPIESGLGDGHATLQGLLAASCIEGSLSDEIVITWGDVFFRDAVIIDELLESPLRGGGLVPAIQANNPYVSLLVDQNMRCMYAEFSKYGEVHLTGLHDQSVFRFDSFKLRTSLRCLHNALWRCGRYIVPGGELSLLHSFQFLYNANDPVYVYETAHPTLSFNTPAEVIDLQRELRESWNFCTRRSANP